jgi:hypothetical protein
MVTFISPSDATGNKAEIYARATKSRHALKRDA